MKNLYILNILLFSVLFSTLSSCGTDDSGDYTNIPEPVSPVVLDLNAVPYQTLSEYKFYEGEMKNLEPAYKVMPYELNSSLFTDYAHKKRFVWMPEGVSATYDGDGKILNFPAGSVLIKNFYYDNVQPDNTTRIIETRLMIKKEDEWIFANYVWNDEQTEAHLDMNGSFVDIAWNENGESKTASYRIPARSECFTCHKTIETAIPIGPKPQNLNKIYPYADGAKNQLTKWAEEGYLAVAPTNVVSTVDWTDETKPLEQRVRSYLDINCAHCHTQGGHCDYRPMKLAFNETADPVNLGVCVQPHEFIDGSMPYIITGGNALGSVLYYRINTDQPNERMPLLGRTLIHEEGAALIEEWINSLETGCP